MVTNSGRKSTGHVSLVSYISLYLLWLAGTSPAYAAARAGFLSRAERTTESRTMEHGGHTREYRLHVPAFYSVKEPVPLVFVFHGGGGKARGTEWFTGFSTLSEKHGFIVVYPQGIDKHWNDGRMNKAHLEQDSKVDDVSFIMALVAALKEEFSIDANRVFSTGISNGGFISQRLAVDCSETFAAVASVTAQMGVPLAARFNPQKQVSVMFMNGTDDPLCPYDGGEIKVNLFPRLSRFRDVPSRGFIVSTDKAVKLWLDHNNLTGPPEVTRLPDLDPQDGATVERSVWSDQRSSNQRSAQSDQSRNVSVVLYKIIGGGHTWPGGAQYLPVSTIGTTCHDIDATKIIWDFFSRHGR